MSMYMSTLGQRLGAADFASYVQCIWALSITWQQAREVINNALLFLRPYTQAALLDSTALETSSSSSLATSALLHPAPTHAVHRTWPCYGPASVCLNASCWNLYTDLDHCVQLTGYNRADKYWLMRNFWVTNWGEDGYIYLELDADMRPVKETTNLHYPPT